MKSLMYRSPIIYELFLRIIHGSDLKKRYTEIARIANGKRVFEAGCGTGILGRYLDMYSGMDINRKFVEYASKKGIKCRVGDIFNDEWDEAEVGVIVDFLHHITPREKELIERMRREFEMVIVIEPVKAFNIPMPRVMRKIWDSIFGDADGVNPFENREKWEFTEESLMEYMKTLGAERTYVLGKDVVAIFRGKKGRKI